MEYSGIKPIEIELKLGIGTRVCIQGLVSNPELNGEFGWICGTLQSGRFPVSLKDQNRTISVRQMNLVAEDSAHSDIDSSSDVEAAAIATLIAAAVKRQKVG
jgi:hypothetical protein